MNIILLQTDIQWQKPNENRKYAREIIELYLQIVSEALNIHKKANYYASTYRFIGQNNNYRTE